MSSARTMLTMIQQLDIANYRSLRRLHLKCDQLMVITGANGVGKTNVYRALSLLRRWALGDLGLAVAEEGGMTSLLWRGPRDSHDHRGGFRWTMRAVMEPFSCELQVGLPPTTPDDPTLFKLAPDIKEEHVWIGGLRPKRSNTLAARRGNIVKARDESGVPHQYDLGRAPGESMLSALRDAQAFPALALLREKISAWRFYHQFRADPDSPLRKPIPGAWTTALASDGHDLAAAVATLLEATPRADYLRAIEDALPGMYPVVERLGSVFHLSLQTPNLDTPIGVAEWSDGTLRYIALATALLAPAAAPLIVLNEPEAGLHCSVLAALARLIQRAAKRSQVWVISHSPELVGLLEAEPDVKTIKLRMEQGQTTQHGLGVLYLDEDDTDDED